jgi:hypothetical protein
MVEMRPVSEGAGVEGGGDGVEVAVPATGGATSDTSEGAGVVGGSDGAEVAVSVAGGATFTGGATF